LVAGNQVRRIVLVRPAVDLRRDVRLPDGAGSGLWIDQACQPPRDLIAELVRLGPGLDNSLSVFSSQIDENARQADGEGPRPRPIDAGQELLAAPAFVKHQIAVLRSEEHTS